MKKTRILSFLYCVCLVIGLLVICVTAASPEGDFTFDAATGTITGYKGSGGDVEIPAIIGGIDVVAIGERAFDDCTNLTNINIPDSVTTIGNFAFGWTGLTSIIIPDGVTTIGQGAFVWTGLTSIIIPESVTIIGIQAFAGCTGLTSINVQSGNTIYKSEGNCIIELATNKLISGCKTSVIPNYVTYIGNNAFEQCSVLTSITIPDNVTTIGNSAFYGCTGLTNIIIPDSVIAIKQNAFANCTGLTNIILSDKVTTIGTGVFSSCISLTSITIPESVTIIGIQAFSGCTGLTSINVQPGNTIYKSEGNCLIEIATNKLISGCKTSVIPNYVTYIEYAFSGCIGLTSIIIPESVTTIGAVAFNGCSGLSSIIIPDKVTTIGNSAFARCTGLTNIIIPDSVTSIGAVTFYECSSLTSIIIPDNVTTIGNNAFGQCIGLSSITFTSPTTTIYDGENTIPTATKIIGYNSSTAKDYAVKYSRTFVVIASPENDFTFNPSTGTITGYTGPGGDVVIPATIGGTNVVAIGDNTFSECDNLTSIIIQDSVTVIGNYAFYHCNGLTSIVIPDSVTTIGSYAFQYCSGLISISIPDSVTTIGQQALCSCFGLISITVQPGNTVYKSEGNCLIEIATNTLIAGCKTSVIPDYITNIEEYAFYGCSGLTSINIPANVTVIGDYAFCGCSGLTSINIPANVTVIGGWSFTNCTGLTSITIPDSVTTIEEGVFISCFSLVSITIPDSVTTIGQGVFRNCYGLISINVQPGNTIYKSEGNCLIETATNTLIAGCKTSVIPDYIAYIGYGAFTGCLELTNIIIPNSVTTIGWVAFSDCVALTSITIPSSVTAIGMGAFYNCTGLTSIYIPASVTYIENNAFHYCKRLTIYGVKDSYVETYAKDNKYTFIAISSTPVITTNPTASDITYGQTLANSTLTGGIASVDGIFTWTNDSIAPAVINSDTTLYSVTFTPNDTVNYDSTTTDITLTVNKANPAYTTPTGLNALYGQTLADVSLPTAANGTFTWEDAITTSVGNVGINYFNVTFTPTDTANYNTINKIEVSVDVGKVTPAITTNPTASDITYGQTLAASNLSGGLASVNGIFSWTDDSITPAVINSDTTLYSVTFTPNDTVNYENVTTEISVIVNKASPTIILEDYNAVYTRNIIKINGATVTLANDEIYNGNITYIYYTDKDCTKLTRKTHGAIIEGSAPRNIGSYFVKASIDETDNYTAATSNIAKLTISMFKPVTYYTIIATSDIGGSLSPSEASVRQNSSKTFIITPDKGYKISDVLIDGVSIGIVKQYTFINVTGNHTIHAEFIPITTYNITTNASEGGRITPQSKVVNEGDNITIRIMPEKGYKINDVIIDGISVGARPVYTFRNITQNHVVTVTFEKR